jgi:hypothetical protein
MQPWLEAVAVAQGWELTPGRGECRLHGVLGQGGVAQNSIRDRHAPIADRLGQGDEGFLVTLLRTVHER